MVAYVPRMLLLGALSLSGAALAFLIGARIGPVLDRVVTSDIHVIQAPSPALAAARAP
jgi:hypothetical protein